MAIFPLSDTLSVPIQTEEFGGKLFSGIFCNKKFDFFDVT